MVIFGHRQIELTIFSGRHNHLLPCNTVEPHTSDERLGQKMCWRWMMPKGSSVLLCTTMFTFRSIKSCIVPTTSSKVRLGQADLQLAAGAAVAVARECRSELTTALFGAVPDTVNNISHIR